MRCEAAGAIVFLTSNITILTCNGTGDGRWVIDGRRQVDGSVVGQYGRVQGGRRDVAWQRFDQEALSRLARRRPSVATGGGGHQRAGGQEETVRNALSQRRTEEDNPTPARFGVIMKLQSSQLSGRSSERLTNQRI